MNRCVVCDSELRGPLYRSPQPRSVTSLCEIISHGVTVHFCDFCGHLQTEAFCDLATYYNQDYKILIASEEEDQLYASLPDGRAVFRTQHQVETLLRLAPPPKGARVLDYGCGKSSTLRVLLESRPDVLPYCYDVSNQYLPFWQRFVPEGNWAVHTVPSAWRGRFDLVTSFFALEHVASPRQFVYEVAELLSPRGVFYCIVPNTYVNPADFVVADHVNHFSEPSLRALLVGAGFEVLAVDGLAHSSSWVVVAKLGAMIAERPAPEKAAALAPAAHKLAGYWSDFSNRVQTFERQHAYHARAAIYGSGFYGTYIASSLMDFDKVTCFLDQNPHRQRNTLLNRKILAPDYLPADTSLVYVGLNPRHARQAVAGISRWNTAGHEYFFA